MPGYCYEVVRNGKVEGTLTMIVPVKERDSVFIRRKTVPDRVTVMGHAADPMHFESSVLGGYYKKEQREGSRFKSEFTKKQIKQIHSLPD